MLDAFNPMPVAAVSQTSSRPFWSVMIPTYNREKYLIEALRSVLDQDQGAERMQICVVDNATTKFSVRNALKAVAGDRVEYIRHPTNIGGIANVNASIKASRGFYVHVLHDDDKVLPGFYRAMESAIELYPSATLFVGPVLGIDAQGFVTGLNVPPSDAPGLMADFLVHQATANRVPTQTVVVPRSVYEQIGGYAEGLAFTPDWEFAFRAAERGQAVTLGLPFAAVRWHEGSDTSALIRGTRHLEEMKATIDELTSRLTPFQQAKLPASRYGFLADAATHYASLLNAAHESTARTTNLKWAYKMDPNLRRFKSLVKAMARSTFKRVALKMRG